MNIWIITTGSSDVQLKTKDRWNTLHPKVRSKLETKKQFSLSESEQSGQKRWLYPSRAVGVVYGQFLTEYYNDLDFPLLNSFSDYLNDESNNIVLNRIIVLLTDQSDAASIANKDNPSHPYWKDTCTLKPILQQYLKNKFPNVVIDSDRDFPVLKPESGLKGLDDWNDILTLVQQEFIKLDIPENATVYVSHQAGTPAISSAVQFVSLARFRSNVQFLVSNEYSQKAGKISRSNYLGAIQLQEAQTLLKRHDYAGVKLLVYDYLPSEIKILLDAAIQWNLAKFDEFANELKKLSDRTFVQMVNERSQHWWWTAYEAAYLGVVRLAQDNTVEALFHSFRAFEGLAIKYAERNGESKKYGRRVFKYLRHQNQVKWNSHPYINTLIDLDNNDEQTRNDILDRRNNLFHNLLGFHKQDVFDAWAADEQEWQARVLGCLNFVSGETQFDSLKYLADATLMAQVHLKLKDAIDSSQPVGKSV